MPVSVVTRRCGASPKGSIGVRPAARRSCRCQLARTSSPKTGAWPTGQAGSRVATANARASPKTAVWPPGNRPKTGSNITGVTAPDGRAANAWIASSRPPETRTRLLTCSLVTIASLGGPGVRPSRDLHGKLLDGSQVSSRTNDDLTTIRPRQRWRGVRCVTVVGPPAPIAARPGTAVKASRLTRKEQVSGSGPLVGTLFLSAG